MQRKCAAVLASALLECSRPVCLGGPFGGAGETLGDCRITGVSASASLDDQGNQISEYQYQFFADSGCGDARVLSSYNLGTRVAEEKMRRADMNEVSSWICPSDPWLAEVPVCQRIDLKFSGTIDATAEDLANYQTATEPLSAIPLTAVDRNALRGQLGNAVKNLPRPADSDIVDYGGCACDTPPAPVFATGPVSRRTRMARMWKRFSICCVRAARISRSTENSATRRMRLSARFRVRMGSRSTARLAQQPGKRSG